jgi:hypothetical protein
VRALRKAHLKISRANSAGLWRRVAHVGYGGDLSFISYCLLLKAKQKRRDAERRATKLKQELKANPNAILARPQPQKALPNERAEFCCDGDPKPNLQHDRSPLFSVFISSQKKGNLSNVTSAVKSQRGLANRYRFRSSVNALLIPIDKIEQMDKTIQETLALKFLEQDRTSRIPLKGHLLGLEPANWKY